ncbi:alpha/beta family hydrolase [Diaminobutyricimonas sp. LJ205]|uniref:alpha/beta hydrolase family protein n=1 Tax=Diaminobutyricimonas sp. LJ205 TaxID=2683590 RepID=UPI0012F4AB10|nr:alpha/beta family hydrolase [Diaminobutyricimonas sp. LJ205]
MPDEALTIPAGDDSVSALYARPGNPFATLVIAHGAGAGKEHPFLAGFSSAMNEEGVATLRFNFPYRDAGRRFPDRPPAAISVWKAVTDAAHSRSTGVPVWAAGKSFGGRMASMAVADGMDVAGLVFLGYPLHPPGKPDKLRDEHLYELSLPMLFLQGTRDSFATPELLDGVVSRIGANAVIDWREGGGHSFEVAGVKKSAAEIGALLAPAVAEFMRANG